MKKMSIKNHPFDDKNGGHAKKTFDMSSFKN